MPVVRRRALISHTAADARGGAHSLGELNLVALCRRERLPEPTRQVLRADASGRPRYLDALFEPWGVHVEIDGAHHMSADQWWNDMSRHNELVRRGEVVLRFSAWKLRDEPVQAAETIRRALRDAGWK
jgi:very-short-patch-repair endonuclease